MLTHGLMSRALNSAILHRELAVSATAKMASGAKWRNAPWIASLHAVLVALKSECAVHAFEMSREVLATGECHIRSRLGGCARSTG